LLNENKYFAEARGVLQDAINRDPNNASLKADLIRVEGEMNGVDAAVAKAKVLASDDPKSNVYYLVAAELYEKAGRPSDAIAMLDKSVAARPSDDALISALAQLFRRMGDPGKAEEVLTRRLKADPKDIAMRAALASLYLTTGRIAEAKKIYIELNSQRPNDAAPMLGLAEVAAKEKNWSEAKDYVDRARAAAPNDPAPEIALVNLYGSQQDWKNAAATANQLAERFPANPDVLDAKGRVQIATSDKEGAIATYKRIHELAPDSLPALSRYLALLNSAKDFPQARAVLQAALARDPKNSQLKGDLLRVESEIDGLEASLAKARALAQEDSGNPVYDLVSAELLEKAGRASDAVILLEKAVAGGPTEDNLVAALSRLYARTGELDKAEAVLNSRLKLEPKDLVIRSALASIYLEQKKYGNAIDEYTRVTADRPADAAALNNLAWLYQQKGDLVKARALAERATSVSPRVPQIDDTLGWILLAQGDAQKALTYLSAASLSAPGNPDIQYHLAVALHRVGRQADAQATLENLLGSGASFSDKAAAEKLLQELKRS
jgi:tetratricopeptide (TPR) repeat protein